MAATTSIALLRFRGSFLLMLVLGLSWNSEVRGAKLHSYAFVNDDGTLRISNTRVHLYGIHIPETGQNCRMFERPIKCAPRAALALDFKIQGFVRCDIIERRQDRSVTGQCFVKDEDLSAYMLRYGWALALPDAPFEYQALEKIAKHHHLGVWGIPVDNIRKRHSDPGED